MRRFLLMMAALVAAICVLAGLTLPRARLTVVPFEDGTVPGVLHIHTNRSDGRSTPDEVAAAAARAGLKFIVFTDHGDGTRQPDPPKYRSGVLCIDGVEISTSGGHYVALDMPPAPYPLAGQPRDVVEYLRRLGGFGIAAHPDSLKPELRWGDWDAPMDGVEWVNPDTSWRVLAVGWGSRFRIFSGVLHYQARPEETLAHLLTDIDEPIARWNAIAAERKIVGLAGADAHANLALRNTDPVETRFSFALPSYESSFRMLSVHVTPERPLSGDATIDGPIVMRAIRAGHLYTAINGLASPPSFEFSAANASGTAHEGDELPVAGPVSLHVRSNAPPGFRTIIWRGSEMLVSVPSEERKELTVEAGEAPAVYRAEVRSDHDDPGNWLLSNAIYVRGAEAREAPRQTADTAGERRTSALSLFDGQTDAGWHVETDSASTAALEVAKPFEGSDLRVRFALAPTDVGNERAALAWGTPIGHPPVNVADYDRLTFVARAERPMRISVQFRTANVGGVMRRWQRSVYLDTVDHERSISLSELAPSDATAESVVPLDQISQILFVVDTVNTKPGTSGRLSIKRPVLEK
jgi:hypothetical protein